MMNKQDAVRIAIKVIKPLEGCHLRAYPDPASELYKELSKHNLLYAYMAGNVEIPEHMEHLSGTPWTIGYGETKGIKKGMVWTQEQADTALQKRVEGFLQEVLKVSPKLALARSERVAAVVSLVYNIGITNYTSSTVARCIANDDHIGAANAFMLWNKAGRPLVVLNGLTKRRQTEKDLYNAGG